MALINCPDCGKDVSDKAERCPNCSFPIFNLKTAAPVSEWVGPPSIEGPAVKVFLKTKPEKIYAGAIRIFDGSVQIDKDIILGKLQNISSLKMQTKAKLLIGFGNDIWIVEAASLKDTTELNDFRKSLLAGLPPAARLRSDSDECMPPWKIPYSMPNTFLSI